MNCFYLAMERALSEAEGWHPFYAVSTMREVVASHMTQETFDLYSLLHRQKAEGFAFMQGLESLEALRKRVRLRGQQVGAHKSVWADGFAMETISNHFCLLLLIVDERFQGSSKFTRIAPRGEGSTSEEANLQSDQATVLLHSSSREHMNLIRYGGKKLLQLGSLGGHLLLHPSHLLLHARIQRIGALAADFLNHLLAFLLQLGELLIGGGDALAQFALSLLLPGRRHNRLNRDVAFDGQRVSHGEGKWRPRLSAATAGVNQPHRWPQLRLYHGY